MTEQIAKRRLGASDLWVPPVALGHSMGQQNFNSDQAMAFDRLVQGSLHNGFNFFDSSDAYWDGLHEQWLARALHGIRKQAIVASKFGNITLPDGKKATDARPAYLRSCCEASLKRLNTDYIDLYYLHRVDPKVPIEETVGEMSRLVEEGKVRYLGLCEASAETLKRAHAVHPMTALQTELSLWYPDNWYEKRDLLQALNISYVGYSPLGRGLLTGQIKQLNDLDPKDRRRIHPRFHTENIDVNLHKVNQMKPLADQLGLSLAQLALAWVLQLGPEVVAVTGTQREKYFTESMAATQVQLPEDAIQKLAQIFDPEKRSGLRYPSEMLNGLNI
jgi:aryl-alcohol dehydrogenase-like predicted oxidoreductase